MMNKNFFIGLIIYMCGAFMLGILIDGIQPKEYARVESIVISDVFNAQLSNFVPEVKADKSFKIEKNTSAFNVLKKEFSLVKNPTVGGFKKVNFDKANFKNSLQFFNKVYGHSLVHDNIYV